MSLDLKRLLLLKYDWTIHVDLDTESIKTILRKEFYQNPTMNGIVNYKSFTFMYNSFLPGIYNYNLVGFDGEICETEMDSEIKLYCRFGTPFIYIYWIAAFIGFFFLLFVTGKQDQPIQFMPGRIWISLFVPLSIYLLLVIFYSVQLATGKTAFERVFSEYIAHR